MSSLGQILRGARLRSGLSQSSLARRAGTTQASVSRIERGLEEPTFARFEALMQSMGWQPSLELKPIAAHREETRRLIADARTGTPSTRLASARNAARFADALRRAVERAA